MRNNIYSSRIAGNDTRTRIRLAAACCDSDEIPKVVNAGDYVIANGVECQAMHNGVLVRKGGYHGDWMSQIIQLLRGHHEPQEELAFHHVVSAMRPGAVMIEGGAFWSYYSLWFQKSVPGSRTILVEPHARRLAVGRENFALNGYRGEFVAAYIGAAPQSADESADGIPTATIDGLMRRFSIDRVHILHMDIQGSEVRMLEGSRKALTKHRIDFVFISTHGDDTLHPSCLDMLTGHGYGILCQHTMQDSFSFDGLIVARSPEAPHVDPISISRRSTFAA